MFNTYYYYSIWAKRNALPTCITGRLKLVFFFVLSTKMKEWRLRFHQNYFRTTIGCVVRPFFSCSAHQFRHLLSSAFTLFFSILFRVNYLRSPFVISTETFANIIWHLCNIRARKPMKPLCLRLNNWNLKYGVLISRLIPLQRCNKKKYRTVTQQQSKCLGGLGAETLSLEQLFVLNKLSTINETNNAQIAGERKKK